MTLRDSQNPDHFLFHEKLTGGDHIAVFADSKDDKLYLFHGTQYDN